MSPTVSTNVRSNLRALMTARGESYRSLAAKAGVDQSSICRILSGATIPRTSTVINLARALNVSTESLFVDPNPNPLFGNNCMSSVDSDLLKQVRATPVSQNVVPFVSMERVSDFLKNASAPEKFAPVPPFDIQWNTENGFASKVSTCDMNPTLIEGDIIYFDYSPDTDIKTADIVLAYSNNNLILGRLLKLSTGNLLSFDNKELRLPEVPAEKIVARAVGYFRPVTQGL